MRAIEDCGMQFIEKIENEFPNVEVGAVQKLVNMTLKYILIFNELGNMNYPIDEKECHCPLDSIILGKLEIHHTPWTRMDKIEYLEVQKEIKKGSISKIFSINPSVQFRLVFPIDRE